VDNSDKHRQGQMLLLFSVLFLLTTDHGFELRSFFAVSSLATILHSFGTSAVWAHLVHVFRVVWVAFLALPLVAHSWPFLGLAVELLS